MLVSGSEALTSVTDRGRSSSGQWRMMCSASFVNGAGATLLRTQLRKFVANRITQLVCPIADARHAVHYAQHQVSGGRRLLILRDARTGKQLGSAISYVLRRKLSHACRLARVVDKDPLAVCGAAVRRG
ncbi:MAG: hypothetical protein ACJAUC_003708 [Planctomycetota bacterium]|jgi:hypothetical protein